MSVAEMAVGYGESVSFTLTDTLELKGIELVNVASDKEDALEAEAFLWRAHLTPLLRDLQESCDAA